MKLATLFSVCTLLSAGAGLMQASVIYNISIDLSPYHAGSTLSGSITLAGPLLPGNTADISLSFSDPADYSPTALTTTLSAGDGTIGNTMRFSGLTFTNVSTGATILLAVNAPAQCATSTSNPNGVPCTANGQWRDHDPARFTGTYTVTATSTTSATPEPSTFVYLGLGALIMGRRALRRAAKKA